MIPFLSTNLVEAEKWGFILETYIHLMKVELGSEGISLPLIGMEENLVLVDQPPEAASSPLARRRTPTGRSTARGTVPSQGRVGQRKVYNFPEPYLPL